MKASKKGIPMKRTTRSAKKASSPDADDPRFAPVIDAFAGDRHVSQGRMFGSIGVKVNGKVFAMVVKGKLVAKLPRERVDELVRSGVGEYFDPGHGKLMKEWVAIAGTKPSWVELAKEAHRFVKGA